MNEKREALFSFIKRGNKKVINIVSTLNLYTFLKIVFANVLIDIILSGRKVWIRLSCVRSAPHPKHLPWHWSSSQDLLWQRTRQHLHHHHHWLLPLLHLPPWCRVWRPVTCGLHCERRPCPSLVSVIVMGRISKSSFLGSFSYFDTRKFIKSGIGRKFFAESNLWILPVRRQISRSSDHENLNPKAKSRLVLLIKMVEKSTLNWRWIVEKYSIFFFRRGLWGGWKL